MSDRLWTNLEIVDVSEEESVEQGRLARPAGAHDGQHLPRLHQPANWTYHKYVYNLGMVKVSRRYIVSTTVKLASYFAILVH